MAVVTPTLIDTQFVGTHQVKTYNINALGAGDTATLTLGERVSGTSDDPIIVGLDLTDAVVVTRGDLGDSLAITFGNGTDDDHRTFHVYCGGGEFTYPSFA